MRDDQRKRLQDLSERLADSFLLEADPGEWPGDGRPPADLTQQERGDRYWCKKNAMATGGVLKFVLDLQARTGAEGGDPERESDIDHRIAEAEKRAASAVERAMSKAKQGFDERVHGKR
jgi:hypothetical protein